MTRATIGRAKQEKFLGRRLQNLRVGAGMSRNELAKKIGITEQQIDQYERELVFPVDSTLKEICQFFSRSRGYFVTTDTATSRRTVVF